MLTRRLIFAVAVGGIGGVACDDGVATTSPKLDMIDPRVTRPPGVVEKPAPVVSPIEGFVGAAADSFAAATARQWALRGNSSLQRDLAHLHAEMDRVVDSVRQAQASRAPTPRKSPSSDGPALGARALIETANVSIESVNPNPPPPPPELLYPPEVLSADFTVSLNTNEGVINANDVFTGTDTRFDITWQRSNGVKGTSEIPRTTPLSDQANFYACFFGLSSCGVTGKSGTASLPITMELNCQQTLTAGLTAWAFWDERTIYSVSTPWLAVLGQVRQSRPYPVADKHDTSPNCVGPTGGITVSALGQLANDGKTITVVDQSSGHTGVPVQLAWSGIIGSSNIKTCNWTANGNILGTGCVQSATAQSGSTKYIVTAIDDAGLSATASGTVIVTETDQDECGPLTNLQPANPFGLAKAGGTLRSPAASFECDPDSGREEPGGGYDGGLCYCQQWFLMVRGQIVDEWWECYDASGNPVDHCYIS